MYANKAEKKNENYLRQKINYNIIIHCGVNCALKVFTVSFSLAGKKIQFRAKNCRFGNKSYC